MTYPKGIDISAHQDNTPSLAGLHFVFCRANYGTGKDRRYDTHSANVLAAGLVLGAYTFGTDSDPIAQADKLLAVAGNAQLLVLDWERNVIKKKRADGTIYYENHTMSLAQAKAFLARVKAKDDRPLGLYRSASVYPGRIGQDFNWIAEWSSTPPSVTWTFWQYRGSPLDLDYFNGTHAELLSLAGVDAPDTSAEAIYTVDRIKGEDWRAKSVAVLRDEPDRSWGVIVHRFNGGEVVRSIGELHTDDGNDWRQTEWPPDSGAPAWMLRSDFDPLVQGGDPKVDARLHAYIDRKDTADYDAGYAAGKVAGMADGKDIGWNDALDTTTKAVGAIPRR